MASLVRRKRKEFECGLCECTGDHASPSEFSLRTSGDHIALCTKCANTLRFSSVGEYEVVGYEIRSSQG